MRVVFLEESDPTRLAAREVEGQSDDGCFSANEIARIRGIGQEEAQESVDLLSERCLCSRTDDDWTGPRSGDERWCLIGPSLTVGREYEVLTVEGDWYRLLDDRDDPVLFHQICFAVSDPTEPTFWVCEVDEDGERHCAPPEWSQVGFWEDYHDRMPEACRRFWESLKTLYPDTSKERTPPAHAPGWAESRWPGIDGNRPRKS